MAIIESFKIYTDRKAKIVINERTGTIVAGGEIQLKPVAIGHGNLSIEIQNNNNNEQGNGSSALHHIDKKTTFK